VSGRHLGDLPEPCKVHDMVSLKCDIFPLNKIAKAKLVGNPKIAQLMLIETEGEGNDANERFEAYFGCIKEN
jgi:hypothetical protein